MLCSSSGNFCVQALNGIEGYQDGKWIKNTVKPFLSGH